MELSQNEAKVKRRSIKAAVTRRRNYLELSQSEQSNKFELSERKNNIINLYAQYDEVQTRLECLETGDDESVSKALTVHAEDRAKFEDVYFQLVAAYEQRISHFERTDSVRDCSSGYNHASLQYVTDSQVRLLKIQLSSFSGSYEEWYTFHDLFDKLIHSNDNLSAIQKFQYLRSLLKDKAAEVVKSF